MTLLKIMAVSAMNIASISGGQLVFTKKDGEDRYVVNTGVKGEKDKSGYITSQDWFVPSFPDKPDEVIAAVGKWLRDNNFGAVKVTIERYWVIDTCIKEDKKVTNKIRFEWN